MNRGRRAENIFLDPTDYKIFIDLLKETAATWNINVAAYCLIPNHYHILLQTPEANLARTMRHLNGVYTQRFNRRHKVDGPLFRGRYKSIVVGGDPYLLQLVRYIHKNPVKAGLVEKPEQYVWSSHKGYLSIAGKWNWLYKEFIYSLLTTNKQHWIRLYRKFMSMEDEQGIDHIVAQKKWPTMIGTAEFIDWIKGKYYLRSADEDVPEAKQLIPDQEKILKTVCQYYGTERNELYKSQRGFFNEPRNVAIYLMRRLRRDRLKQICAAFQMNKYSSVSSIIERMKKEMKKDRKLNNRVKEITALIIKSQKQT
jgi:REP element-mobilizing transposase RayT